MPPSKCLMEVSHIERIGLDMTQNKFMKKLIGV